MKVKVVATVLFLLATVPYFALVPFLWALPFALATYLYCGLLMNVITHFEERVVLVFVLWFPAMVLDKPEWLSD